MTTRRKFIKQSSAIVAGGLLGGNLFSACQTKETVLTNRSGIRWQPEDIQFFLRNTKDGSILPLPFAETKRTGDYSAEFSGRTEVDGIPFTFKLKATIDQDAPAVSFTPSWNVDKDLNDWEVAFAYQKGFTDSYRAQSYPFAGNSDKVDINPMRYCGIPGVLLYKQDLSDVLFYTIDSRSDYLNPTTWTGKTRFAFADGSVNPCFYACGGEIKAGVNYELPLQLFQDKSGKFETAITNIVETWMKAVDYKVEPLFIRTPQEAFDIVAESRRRPKHWIEGLGFKHNNGAGFCYPGEYPQFAIYDYYIALQQTDAAEKNFWRDRAFKQIDYLLKGQQPGGVFHTTLNFKPRKGGSNHYGHVHSDADNNAVYDGYCSSDHGHCAYKPDINAMTARYLLKFWKYVKDTEGVDRKEWYDAAVKSFDYILSQQNEDGGFPQCVDITTGKKSASTVCGRTMVALPFATKITGDPKYLNAALKAEKFLRENVQNKFWYTGAHPDLPPQDFEQDSIYNVVEYWLDKYDRANDPDALNNAIANAHYAFLYWCPKQLSWVKAPTQLAHSEQQNYNTYAVYCYNNRKVSSLDRLYKATKNNLYLELRDRIIQNNLYPQHTDGDWKGAMPEAIADPWMERRGGFEYKGVIYPNEITLELMQELIDTGLAK